MSAPAAGQAAGPEVVTGEECMRGEGAEESGMSIPRPRSCKDQLFPTRVVVRRAGGKVFDLSQLEGSKENVQPLKKGRNPKQLLHALEVQHKAGVVSPLFGCFGL
jgi:hypothetical protein